MSEFPRGSGTAEFREMAGEMAKSGGNPTRAALGVSTCSKPLNATTLREKSLEGLGKYNFGPKAMSTKSQQTR